MRIKTEQNLRGFAVVRGVGQMSKTFQKQLLEVQVQIWQKRGNIKTETFKRVCDGCGMGQMNKTIQKQLVKVQKNGWGLVGGWVR